MIEFLVNQRWNIVGGLVVMGLFLLVKRWSFEDEPTKGNYAERRARGEEGFPPVYMGRSDPSYQSTNDEERPTDL